MRSKSEMIEVMKQALDALECINSPLHMTELRSVGRAITALRAAIAEAAMQRLTDVQQEIEHSEDALEMVEPVAWEAIEKIAQERYKVGPSDTSMFYRFAVLAGNGTQHLYIGREIECQNMARKFAGAFLDGAFLYEKMATSPRREWVGLTDVQQEMEREPLSIETINKLWNDAVGWGDASSNEVTFVRTIERAHGIGGEE